ncbi:MAG: copper chaperone [Clostridia bacterium]|nr:copper chaperone [Clostridia bacterium]
MHCCGGNDKVTVKLNVEGMSCNHCKMTVEKELGQLSGVENVDVDLEGKTVTVTYDKEKVTEDKLKEIIKNAGYEVK